MTCKTYIENTSGETAANAAICLSHQTNCLLDQRIRTLEKNSLKEDGFTERLYRTGSNVRNRKG